MTFRRTRDSREAGSFAAVVVVTAIALVLGLLLRTSVQQDTKRVDQGGVSVDVPTSWIVLPGIGDTLLAAYDPRDPNLRYGVAALTSPAGTALGDAATRRLRDRRQLLDSFAPIDEGPASLGTIATYRVRYAFVDKSSGGVPVVIETNEQYFTAGRRILVAVLEAPRDKIAAALPAFERFARGLAERTTTGSAPATVARVATETRAISLAGGANTLTASIGGVAPVQAAGATGPAALISSTTQIMLTTTVAGAESVYGWGSGTIISADGLILTNAHVAKPNAPGRGLYEGDPVPAVEPESLVIAMVTAEDKPPVPTYRATVVLADGYLDAAVIKIDRNYDGSAILPGTLNLPFLQLGDSDVLRVGDHMTIVGFPGIGGDTVSLSAGEVSGFLGDDRIGQRAWVKTDAVVSHGNSGGLAANDAGQLVGIPSRGPDDVGGYSFIRPINLVKPLIDAAKAGNPAPPTKYYVDGTGRESLQLDSWTTDPSQCPVTTKMSTYATGARQIVAVFKEAGLATGEDILSQWRMNGDIIYRAITQSKAGEAGGCLATGVGSDRGLPDGDYVVEMFVGPTLRQASRAETVVGAATATTSASVAGRVVDADSRKPIAGAVIFFLKPGTDPATWLGKPDAAQLVSTSDSAADGQFEVLGLTAGRTYSVVVIADGYAPIGGPIGPVKDGRGVLTDDLALVKLSP
ncbi:MAG: trypsin-like peptidase domain-containing protein [Chloroflexota bacterium]|nr:trypsin-like peptidase domain-containing protein [Chloroflexota bacterium]